MSTIKTTALLITGSAFLIPGTPKTVNHATHSYRNVTIWECKMPPLVSEITHK